MKYINKWNRLETNSKNKISGEKINNYQVNLTNLRESFWHVVRLCLVNKNTRKCVSMIMKINS